MTEDEWRDVDQNLGDTDIVFVIHVMDGENAARLLDSLQCSKKRHRAVIVINCMPDLMRRTGMGKLDLARLLGVARGATGSRKDAHAQQGADRSKTKSSLGML